MTVGRLSGPSGGPCPPHCDPGEPSGQPAAIHGGPDVDRMRAPDQTFSLRVTADAIWLAGTTATIVLASTLDRLRSIEELF
jgi:hypothetical protein